MKLSFPNLRSLCHQHRNPSLLPKMIFWENRPLLGISAGSPGFITGSFFESTGMPEIPVRHRLSHPVNLHGSQAEIHRSSDISIFADRIPSLFGKQSGDLFIPDSVFHPDEAVSPCDFQHCLSRSMSLPISCSLSRTPHSQGAGR